MKLCAVCRLAGLTGCPARGARLPLVEHEKAQVVYRGPTIMDGYYTTDSGNPLMWPVAWPKKPK